MRARALKLVRLSIARQIGTGHCIAVPFRSFSMAKSESNGKSNVLKSIVESDYEPQLEEKRVRIEALFAGCNAPPLEVFKSKPAHYRMRAEFSVWHEEDDSYYVMYEKGGAEGKGEKVRVESFPVASELVNELMAKVRTWIIGCPSLRRKLFQVNFHTTLHGEAMITMIYHRKLDDDWKKEALNMKDEIRKNCAGLEVLHVIGRSRKQKMCLDADEVTEVLDVQGRGKLQYIQVEGAFSQPNAYICASMLGWAVEATKGSQDHDLLELYCGNGNFTAAVAPNFRQVLATEISKPAVKAAKKNFENNNVRNIFVARMSSEEFTEAWKSVRQYKRLDGLDVKECCFKTLLVDPPRAGLDPETRKLMREFDRVLYISCNPDTLKRDFESASDIFEIKSFAMFDQFPYTHHVECGLYLIRKECLDSSKKQRVE
eukprot:jgi/Picsp_1/5348/NSC_02709-R1_trna (uracil-5-)-methyltransferase